MPLKHRNVQGHCQGGSSRRPRVRLFEALPAARGGLVRVIRLCAENESLRDKRAFADAAGSGARLEILKIRKERGSLWYVMTCSRAAGAGKIRTLEWLQANVCPWDKTTCATTAPGGQLETLRFCQHQGCECDRYNCKKAAGVGLLDVLEFCCARMHLGRRHACGGG